MLFEQIIANNPSLQPYECISTVITEDRKRMVLHLESRRNTAEEACPYCGGHMHICGSHSMKLRDMPINPGTRQDIEITYHRYRCQSSARTFSEEITFKYPEARISAFLRFNIPISTEQKISGVHWDTIYDVKLERRKISCKIP